MRLIRIQRALAGIEGVGRVHVYKWGDGGAHLHIVLVARPVRMMRLRGMFLTTWMNVLSPLDPNLWMAIRSHVRTVLDAASAGANPPTLGRAEIESGIQGLVEGQEGAPGIGTSRAPGNPPPLIERQELGSLKAGRSGSGTPVGQVDTVLMERHLIAPLEIMEVSQEDPQ